MSLKTNGVEAAQTSNPGKIEESVNPDKNGSQALVKNNVNINKAADQKASDILKFFKNDEKAGKNDIYKLKFEIVDTDKAAAATKDNSDINISKNILSQSSGRVKNSSESLTIEKLVASKSSLKDINKDTIQEKSASGKSKIKNITDVKVEIENNINDVESGEKNKIPITKNQAEQTAELKSEIKNAAKESVSQNSNLKDDIKESGNKAETDGNQGKIISKNSDEQPLGSKNDLKNVNKFTDGNDISIKIDLNKNGQEIKSQTKLNQNSANLSGKINELKTEEKNIQSNTEKSDNQKSLNTEQINKNPDETNQKNIQVKVLPIQNEIKSSDIAAKPNSNIQEKIQAVDINNESNKEIKAAAKENQNTDHKEATLKSHSADNYKTGDSGKVNLNNSYSG